MNLQNMSIRNIFKFDYVLFSCLIILSVFSIATLYDYNNPAFYARQIVWSTISILLFLFISRMDFSFLKNTKLVIIFYLVSCLLLVATLIFGQNINGAKAWLNFGFFSLQPADILKLSLVILLAKYFSKRHVEIQFLRHIIVSLLYAAIPVAIIMKQPDLGSAVVIMFIWFFIVFIAGLSKKHLFILISTGAIIAALMWNFALANYQKERVLNFASPMRDIRGSGYNVYQALIAIGSGGTYGKDVGFGSQSKLNFLPEYETDFIFSAYAEEWGFVGVAIILIIYFIMLSRILYIAKLSSDNFFSIISLGVFAWVFVHVFINVSMNLGLFPVTGLPLPFMSYGGSHFIMLAVSIGLVSSFSNLDINLKKKVHTEFLGY